MSETFDPFSGPELLASVPTTEPQREIWTSAQLGPDANLAYNESVSVLLRGPLDVPSLERALQELVQRHEVLRSTFSNDGLTLLVAASVEVPLVQHDLTGRPGELEALTVRAVSEPFDLEKGPLVRAQLAKLSPSEHVLVFTAHHIVVDGWSTAVLLGDLARLYSGSALAPAASFVEWGRRPADASDEAYWVSRFAGELPVLELPGDRPRPPLKTYASRRHDLVIGEALVARLKKAGAKQHASLFAVLLAGWKALLHRLTGQEDLVVGVPIAGQALDGWDTLAGHCVNMLPLRTRVDPAASVAAFVADVRRTLLDAQSHPHCTLGQLLQKLPVARDASRLPLVNVIFNVDRAMGSDAMPFAGVTATLEANPRRFETYDVFVNAVDDGGRVKLECQYNTDVFEAATIRRWLEAYERLLGAMVVALELGEGTLGALDVLGESDRQQLEAWNRESALEVDPSLTVVDLLEEQLRKSPQAIAVECEGRALSYAELHSKADALAAWLRARGVGPGGRVGISLERGVDMLVALVGVLKSGAAYVPLDPAYPRERLDFMIADAGIEIVLTKLEEAAPAPAPRPQPEQPAYVIYTSGSTGKPKGVGAPHRAVVNLLKSVARTPGLSGSDTVLAVTTLSFDIAVSELLLPLTVGARIVIATREVASDGARLLEALKTSKATFLDATPATYRMLIDAGWSGGTALDTCICTGEAMPRELAVELAARVPHVWNGYGPTETCVWSTFFEVKAPVTRVLIGKAVANTELFVLDARGEPVLPGVVGELWIGGRGVALGYLNRPELTRERFVNGRYRTGDLVRQLPDGSLECLGRNDSQVKLRGYRIELHEIEDALSKHPAVKQAACALHRDHLAAWVVCQPGAAVDDAELRRHLERTLPAFMVPQRWATLERMPLTPSGKVDKKALPAPEASSASADRFVAPRTETEALLAQLWQEVLGVGRVGANDDFFALGGHSLLASQLLGRLRRARGVELSFRKIFEAPVLSQLAAAVDEAKAQPREVAPIPRREGPAPLSIHQRRIWLLEEMDPAQKLVHALPAAWRLKGPLDADRLQRALDDLAQRHATLRTAIRLVDGQPMQIVLPDRRLAIERVDLSEVGPAQRDERLSLVFRGMIGREFDLSADVLARHTLVRLDAGEHALLTVRHAAIWDGGSFDVFLHELSELYAGRALAELPVRFGDFAAWQAEWLESPEVTKQVAYWRQRLEGPVEPLALPTDRPRTGSRSVAGDTEAMALTREQADALAAFALAHQATPFMVLFSAFVTLLHRYTGQTDLVVGTPVRARSRPELEGVIGLFTNAVLLRVQLDPRWTFVELLQHVREVTLDAFGHQDVPLELLGDSAPMVRAFFSLQDIRARPQKLGELELCELPAPRPAAGNELMLWAEETPDALSLVANYSTELFDATTIRRFLDQLKQVVTEVLTNAARPVVQLPVLPVAEQQRLAQLALGQGGSLVQALGLTEADAPKLGEALREGIAITDRWVAATEPKWLELLDDGVAVDRAICLGVPSRALRSGLLTAVPSAWSLFIPPELQRPIAVMKLGSDPRRLAGAVLPGLDARVVASNGGPCPIGVWGALEVGGTLTQQRVRWVLDGVLELDGRTDGQWELDGQLGDPRLLSSALEQHPAIERAAPVLAEDPSGRPAVVVFVSVRRGETFTETELRKRVRAVLPAAFVPRRFVELDGVPLTASGEPDAARLPPPFPRGDSDEVVLPRSEAEKKVAARWLEVLRLPCVSVHDNFFDSGGHSLLALQVIERLFEDTGVRVPPRLMLLGTLEMVASAIDGGKGVRAAMKTTTPVPAPASGLFGKLKDLVKG